MGWLSGWSKRVKLTLDSGDVDANLSNFPILVYISTGSGYSNDDISFVFDELTSNANRKKIAVTQSNGTTECYVEIEKWDNANEQAWLWSKVPSITSGSNTVLYLYYDSAHADNDTYVGDTNDVVAENVWDSNFKLVCHMQDDPDTSHVRDSTSNDNDGTKLGADEPIEALGKIGSGQYFDGGNDRVDLSTGINPLSALTLEAWINPDVINDWKQSSVICKMKATGAEYVWKMGLTNIGLLRGDFYKAGGGTCSPLSGLAADVSQWNYIVASVLSTGNGIVYLNNVAGTPLAMGDTLPDIAYNSFIGYEAVNLRYFIGFIDEVRVSNIQRSSAWVGASYETQRDHFITYESEEILVNYDKIFKFLPAYPIEPVEQYFRFMARRPTWLNPSTSESEFLEVEGVSDDWLQTEGEQSYI